MSFIIISRLFVIRIDRLLVIDLNAKDSLFYITDGILDNFDFRVKTAFL